MYEMIDMLTTELVMIREKMDAAIAAKDLEKQAQLEADKGKAIRQLNEWLKQ